MEIRGNVIVVLDSSTDLKSFSSHSPLYQCLRIKMQHSQKPFSLTFRYVTSLVGDFDLKLPNHEFANSQRKNNGTAMNDPCDVKITSSLIMVSDASNCRILFFDLKTKTFKFTIHDPHRPYGMAVDPYYDSNSLYITCRDNYVKKYDLESRAVVWSKFHMDFHYPCGIVVESHQVENAKVIVADCGNRCFRIFSKRNGDFIAKWEYQLERLTEMPFGLELDGDGDILCTNLISHTVSCISKNVNHLKVYWTMGKKGTQTGEFQYPRGVFFEKSTSLIYVCDQSNNRINVFSNRGDFIQSFGSPKNAPGSGMNELNAPVGLCISETTGELFVVDMGNNRVQVFK
ncbi:hypothetical protein C9374_012033 [Naegleria lovaniensis]|uniref:Uncharacterized protein n=1 Tax=Naegleria lovaniensis TaxID=51637 RepID=A0AA88GDS4_NAELO|nr:uncharacterized protein C9374_012033 [Naegleria lovaniensis]KAG2373570.1 hypothetical protein C9374_012033 [Naegleria lovaniensis]